MNKAIRVTPMPGETAVYTLFNVEMKLLGIEKPAEIKEQRTGYMIVNLARGIKKDGIILPTGPQEIVIGHLLHVWIDPKFRRKKNGAGLIGALKEHADVIYAEPLTPEGRYLIEACGFTKADNMAMYMWVK